MFGFSIVVTFFFFWPSARLPHLRQTLLLLPEARRLTRLCKDQTAFSLFLLVFPFCPVSFYPPDLWLFSVGLFLFLFHVCCCTLAFLVIRIISERGKVEGKRENTWERVCRGECSGSPSLVSPVLMEFLWRPIPYT